MSITDIRPFCNELCTILCIKKKAVFGFYSHCLRLFSYFCKVLMRILSAGIPVFLCTISSICATS